MKKFNYTVIVFTFFSLFVMAPAIVLGQSASSLKTIQLTWTDHVPPNTPANAFFKKVIMPKIQEQIAKAGYQLDITYYHASSLYKMTDQVQACDQGMVDITVLVMPYETERFPLHEVLDFAFMGWDGPTVNKVWTELTETIPEFKNEISGFEEIFRYIPTNRELHHNLKGARVPADFKGKKIHATGLGAEMFKAIGGAAMRMNPGDWYTALNRGLMDGISIDWGMINMMKLYETVNNHLSFTGDGLGYSVVTHVMNRKKFDSLPPEVQMAIKDNMMWASEVMADKEVAMLPEFQKAAKERGNNFVQATAEETDKWRAAVKGCHENWIEEMEAKGLPGKKVYEEARRLTQEHIAK